MVACLPYPAAAQRGTGVDVFGGYSYLRTDSTGSATTVGVDAANLQGWEISARVGLTPRLGLWTSLSGQYGSPTGNVGRVAGTASGSRWYAFLFGPSYVAKQSDNIKFALHAAGGVVRTGGGTLQLREPIVQPPPLFGPPVPPITSVKLRGDTSPALAVGGSLDVRLTDGLSWRVVHPELVVTFSPTRHFARLSTGLVFHLGRIR
jgi:hypothetical protein